MEVIEQEKELFEETSRPLREEIHQFGTWRNAWQAEKQRWNEWQPILLEDGDLDQLKSTFEEANDTIDRALDIILSQLNSMLAVQERAGNIQAKIIALISEFDSLIIDARSDARSQISPRCFLPGIFLSFQTNCGTHCKKAWIKSHGQTAISSINMGWLYFSWLF